MGIYGAYEGTACDQATSQIQEFNQSHSDVFKINCDRGHSGCSPDGDRYKHKRKKQAWAVDTYIDLNDYYCKDTNTKYKKEDGGVGS